MGRRAVDNPEAGYALLFVYMMAAVVAIMLYSELPRVAFEAQREKEQLLIDRGEQYSRAILLYVRKNNRFPADFDALDKTAGQRFLRHRYKDPMTGKEEWRIIHVGPGGVFTDSVLYTKKGTDKKSEPQNFITELQPVGGTVADPNAQGANIGLRRRPSDQPGTPGSVPGTDNGAIPNGAQNGIPNGAPDGLNGIPNGVQPNNVPGGVPGQPGAANGLQLPPGVQFPPGMQPPQGYGQTPPQQQTLQQGSQQPFAPSSPSPTAANLINQILTTPRPGGLNGLNGATQGAAVDQFGNPLPQGAAGGLNGGPGGTTPAPLQGQSIGGGIAGVASKLEREGIKIYKERKAYNEWEFVYDLSQDKSRTGLGTGAQGGAVNGAVAGGATSGAAGGQTASQTASQTTQQTTPPAPPVYTPPVNNPEPPQPTALPSPFPGGVPGGGPGTTQPGQPGFPVVPTTQGGPESPGIPNPGQPGTPIYPIPGNGNNGPGGIVPSPPIGGGGIVPSPPIGGGAPH